MTEQRSIEMRVRGDTNANKVAGAVAKNVQEGRFVSLVAIGASAVNQMVKAVTIARGMLASAGYDSWFTTGFTDEMVQGAPKTAMRLLVHTNPGPDSRGR